MKLKVMVELMIICIYTLETCLATWLNIVRSMPMKTKQRNATKAVIQRRSHPQGEICRKDRHCGVKRFCHRYLKLCEDCKQKGQSCRRNKMCCQGMECANSVCRLKVQPGLKGSLCRRDRDCNVDHCCAKQNGQSVCKPMLKEGDFCNLPGKDYLWTHGCPCKQSLKCKKTRRRGKRLRGIKDLTEEWNTGRRRRCVYPRIKIT